MPAVKMALLLAPLIRGCVITSSTTGFALAPAIATAACNSASARDHISQAGLNYERMAFAASAIAADDARYAWASEWGRVRMEGGSMLLSSDPALFEIRRYAHSYSTALTRSGRYLLFEPVSYADRTISEIRLASAPELGGAPPIGAVLTQARPGEGPAIPGYRFQMAERLAGESQSYLGLWRRTGSVGARTLLVHFARRPERRDGYETRIVGRSQQAFSLISEAATLHGGAWSFTLFTEATCPGSIAVLRYVWMLYIPRARQ